MSQTDPPEAARGRGASENERYLRELYEITSDPDSPFEEKLDALFALGCERFDLDLGGIARIDPETDLFEVSRMSGEHDQLVPGARADLSETYCRLVTDGGDTVGVSDPVGAGFEGAMCYEEFGVQSYLGTHLELDDGDRTFFFISTEPREAEFSAADRTFHHLMGEWVRKGLQRERSEAKLRRKTERLESFAAMLAHELRNPLNIAQLYLPSAAEGDEAAAEEVAAAHDRIEEMIDVLLVTARGADSTVDWEAVALSDAVEAAREDASIDSANVVVETGRTVRADRIHLQHLLQNLFRNSVEHGGRDVTIRVGDLDAAERSEDEARQAAKRTAGGFYVEDDGPGVPAAERERIFDAGYTTGSDGIGLGLTFVAQVADAYGWEYAIAESDDGGARFEFTNVDAGSPE